MGDYPAPSGQLAVLLERVSKATAAIDWLGVREARRDAAAILRTAGDRLWDVFGEAAEAEGRGAPPNGAA